MPSSRRVSLPHRRVACWPLTRFIQGTCFAVASCAGAPAHAQRDTPAHAQRDTPARAQRDTPAHAVSANRIIVLVRMPGDDGIIRRLRAELGHGDWRFLELRLDERQPAPPLSTIAEAARASAAIRFDERSSAVELWVARTGGAIHESLVAPDEQAHDQVLALRAAEALRARGLELPPLESSELLESSDPLELADPLEGDAREPGASSTAPAVVAPDRVPKMPEGTFEARPASSRADRAVGSGIWLGIAPGVALSPGGIPPLAVGIPELRLELARWSFSAIGIVPLTRAELRGDEGHARVGIWMIGGAADFWWTRAPVFGARSGLGFGASATTMSGDAAAGYLGVDDAVHAATAFVRSSITIALGHSLRLAPSALIGWNLPRTRIDFADRNAARWGAPFAALGVALEASALRWDERGARTKPLRTSGLEPRLGPTTSSLP